MKKKVVLIVCLIISLFVVSSLFVSKKNNVASKGNEQKVIKVVSETKKEGLYATLSNYVIEDYSYKKPEVKISFTENIIREEKILNNDNDVIEKEEIIIEEKVIEENNETNNLNDESCNKEFVNEKELETKEENINKNLNEETKDIVEEETLESQNKMDETIEIKIEENNEVQELNDNKLIKEDSYEEVIIETIQKKNGFIKENNITYYYEDDKKITGVKSIDGVNNYFSPSGRYLGTTNIKVIDVSYYQGDINWEIFKEESDCYGVILRLGYYDTLDKKFERNINELKRLNIPYGIYLFSYSTTINGANKEADFTNKMIDYYNLKPTLGIYYDIESWTAKNGASSNDISKEMYDNIIQIYINKVSYHTNYNYKVKVYSGRWYAMNRLGNISKKYVDWVAEYNKTCKYDGNYSMWQYTSKGIVPGINGNVDISYLY